MKKNYIIIPIIILILLGFYLFKTTGTLGTTINSSSGIGGTIDPEGLINVTDENDLYFEIIPEIGYHINDVYIDNTSIGVVTSYLFETDKWY